MVYLVTHIAVCLVFAQLLGVVLGWLLWGYPAREHAKAVQALRERLADLQLVTPRMVPQKAQASLAPAPEDYKNGARGELIDGQNTRVKGDTGESRRAFYQQKSAEHGGSVSSAYIAPDLDAEVKEERLRHYEQQIRELENVRVPMLETALREAIAGKREAEGKVEAIESGFEDRASDLISQVRNFERAAQEWDLLRDELEHALRAKDKDLSTAAALLRNLQNSQQPERAEPLLPPGLTAREAADLRDRYQKVVAERDSLAAEFAQRKQIEESRVRDSRHIAELEETLRTKDALLNDQAAQVESLLWRVAELEPLAEALPRLENDLIRLQTEIVGHVALHAESSANISALLNRVAELESETAAAAELSRVQVQRETALRATLSEARASHEAELQRVVRDYDSRLAEFNQLLEQTDQEIRGHEAARAERTEYIIKLEQAHSDKDLQLVSLNERLSTLEVGLATARQALVSQEIESRSQLETQLEALQTQHQAELARLRATLAQRLRRVWQSL